MQNPTAVNTNKTNFVNYLDNLKNVQLDYVRTADALYLIRASFQENFLLETSFNGYTKEEKIQFTVKPSNPYLPPSTKFEQWKTDHEHTIDSKFDDDITIKEK